MIAERIKSILDKYQLSASGLADIIGVQRSAISHILSQRNRPSLEMVARILEKFPNVDADWLLTGKGTMDQLMLFNEEPLKPKEEKKTTKVRSTSFQEEKRKLYADKFNQIQSALVTDFKEDVVDIQPVANKKEPAPSELEIDTVNIHEPIPPIEIKSPKEKPTLSKEDFSLEEVFSHEAFSTTVPTASTPSSSSKKIEKIIIFYDDKTFSIYQPEP